MFLIVFALTFTYVFLAGVTFLYMTFYTDEYEDMVSLSSLFFPITILVFTVYGLNELCISLRGGKKSPSLPKDDK